MGPIGFSKNLMLSNKYIFICLIFVFFSLSFKNDKESYLTIPKGFPTPLIPDDNTLSEDRIKLGKKLFLIKFFLEIHLFLVLHVINLNMLLVMD